MEVEVVALTPNTTVENTVGHRSLADAGFKTDPELQRCVALGCARRRNGAGCPLKSGRVRATEVSRSDPTTRFSSGHALRTHPS
jgi:hypothetical protein